MRYLPAVIVDVVLVLIFAVIGRASHQEDPGGLLLTAWPFLVALLVGHGAAALFAPRPHRPWSVLWGAIVWVVTVSGGLLLRVLSGDTAELPFVIVAALVLGAFLIGWRALTALLRRRRSGAAREEPDVADVGIAGFAAGSDAVAGGPASASDAVYDAEADDSRRSPAAD